MSGRSAPASSYARPVLLSCVFLSIFGEVLLSPFYPQFFAKVFGVQDLTYTGFYILVCRLTVILISPIWGLLSRKFAVKHLLLVGQAGTAVCTAWLAFASHADQFLLITVVLLLFKSSYMFIYPLLVEAAGDGKMALSAGSYHVAYHTAIVLSSLAGVALFSMEQPLLLFLWIAATDIIQLLMCWLIWKGLPWRRRGGRASALAASTEVASALEKDSKAEANANVHGASEEVAAALSPQSSGKGGMWMGLFMLGITLLAFHLAIHMIRPYFTRYMEMQWHLPLMASTALYLIPNVVAACCFFAVRRLDKEWSLKRTLSLTLPLLAASLALQGVDGGVMLMIVSRCLFGLGLVLAQASLELLLFKSSQGGRLHLNYGMAMAFQNGGQLLAPLAASLLFVPYGGASLFYGGAVLSLFCLLLLWMALFRTKRLSPLKDT
ncbi:MFS transporter [Paenibacillus sp. GCM10027627]|uniref:MFS transporter n=1 Tax=unclassified Paenibacillus TaxID=185978 RepID=UPI0036446565